MTFAVAITTYNRPLSLANLVRQVGECTMVPDQIIVVDSSETSNLDVKSTSGVTYVVSSHKNQPYQRYLAYRVCKTDVIIFLDDDLEVTDKTVFEIILTRLLNSGVKGVSVGFEHHHTISEILDAKVNTKSVLFKAVNFLSGVPVLRPGRIHLVGLAGPRPMQEGLVDYFNGAIMAFYKNELEGLFNPTLFSLFEKKLGMGEDKVISMSVGLTSRLWYVPGRFFLHPPSESNYFQDVKSFQRKVMYSRLYLSLRYGELKQYSRWIIYLHYYYYAGWRLLIASVNALLKPSALRSATVLGILQGVFLTLNQPFKAERITPEIDWLYEASVDTKGGVENN